MHLLLFTKTVRIFTKCSPIHAYHVGPPLSFPTLMYSYYTSRHQGTSIKLRSHQYVQVQFHTILSALVTLVTVLNSVTVVSAILIVTLVTTVTIIISVTVRSHYCA